MSRQFNENLEHGDLKRIVHNELHIDEFKSKMGTDADVCVISFKLIGKEAAADLVSFIEKGYIWVLDADVSSGEKEDGTYLVFVEIPRNTELPVRIYKLIEDISNLTEHTPKDWRVRNHTAIKEYPLTIELLQKLIPLTAERYLKKYPIDVKPENDEINKLKQAAGLDINTKAPVNEFTESLRIAAGIR